MKSKILVLILGLLLILALSACTAETPALDGTEWNLVEFNSHPLIDNTVIWLKFSEGRISGKDGCNLTSGAYTVRRDKIRFTNIFHTLMGCLIPGSEDQSHEYYDMLDAAKRFEINQDQISLLDKEGSVIAIFTLQDQELAGTSWTVTRFYVAGQRMISPLADTQLTLRFSADGKLSGSAGCNGYFANYETEDGSIKITGLGNNLKDCPEPEGLMEQEEQYLKALQTVVFYHVEAGILKLRWDEWMDVIRLEKAE